ncbi:hypothetical protein OF83DRAFT_1178055 [Amylostereum chailletii]|nr:hypothetical protein OF83DRAFT_1178055 [Amylostereum chailletii]
MPAEIVSSFQLLEEDPTVYAAMWGPSEFYVNGTLEDWSVLEEISKITCPTLLLNGRYDEAQDSGMLPFFQGLKTVKWIQFASSAHMAQYEERDRFMDVVGRFLS